MLEMGFLVISYIETVGVKWPGRKKIFCLFSDTLARNLPIVFILSFVNVVIIIFCKMIVLVTLIDLNLPASKLNDLGILDKYLCCTSAANVGIQ